MAPLRSSSTACSSSARRLDLGKLAKHQSRTFRFLVTFPQGGEPPTEATGDNAYMASRMVVDFLWRADGQEIDDDDPKPEPKPPVQSAGPSAPGAGGAHVERA